MAWISRRNWRRRTRARRIQAEVVQCLQFRGADRHVAELLASAYDETWQLVARRGYAEEIRDKACAERLKRERNNAVVTTTDPAERLRLLLQQLPDYAGRDEAITSAIADPAFPVNEPHANASLHHANEQSPSAVLQGLTLRMEAGLAMPSHADELLRQFGVTDAAPIAQFILNLDGDRWATPNLAVLAGPQTTSTLLDEYLRRSDALKEDRNNSALSEECLRLRDRLMATRSSVFIDAVLARSDLRDTRLIGSVCAVISVHGGSEAQKSTLPLNEAQRPKMLDVLRTWARTVLGAPSAPRYELVEVANAIGRCGLCELLPEIKQLIDEDLVRLQRALEARRQGNRADSSDVAMRYGNQYGDALVLLGSEEAAAIAAGYLRDQIFGADAALALKEISDVGLGIGLRDFRKRWPWLDEIPAARAKRAVSPRPTPANALAVPIFETLDELAKPDNEATDQLQAIRTR